MMTAAEMKREINSLPFCSKTIATGAIVDLIIDRVAEGRGVDLQVMELLVSDILRLTGKHRDLIERESSRVSA